MATSIAATSGASGGSYALQTARREAQQAEQSARALNAQAQSAQRVADQEQNRADSLSAQAADANDRSATARGKVSAASNSSTDNNASARAAPAPRSVPFVNASGQVTGLLLNAVA